MKQLLEAYDEYINLLCEEIESMVIIAKLHGWKSENVKAGEECRKKIEDLKKKISKEKGDK